MDPITDMLNRIRNAQAVLHPTVDVPFSNLKYEIVKILEKQGFIEKAERRGRKAKKIIEIILKYDNGTLVKDVASGEREARSPRFAGEAGQRRPVISGLKRISKPGQRIYVKAKELRPIKGGYGMAVISTPEGLMTNKEARKKRLGGEIICEIW